MIILQGPNGQRKVQEGEPYRLALGEIVIGSEKNIAAQKEWGELQTLSEQQGIAWGDMVAAATKVLGIKPCSSCEKRRQIMNEVNKLGVAKAFELIKATFKA